MIIEKNTQPYTIFVEETIKTAIERITKNRAGIIFAVDQYNHLEGLFTNGDLMRWFATQSVVDLQQPIAAVINTNYIYAHIDDDATEIEERLKTVLFVPLVDDRRHLVGIARHRSPEVQIADFSINDTSPTFVIAEIGINHNGSLERALALIDAAAETGADCAKFQMRDLESLYINAGEADDARENLGSQYTLDLLTRFELTPEDMYTAFDHCKARGLIPLCTPWDLKSLERLEAYGMPGYKVASADMTNHELLRAIAQTGKPMICSTGMSDEAEIKESVAFLQRVGAKYILLQCNSTYPAPFKDVHLRYLPRLAELGDCFVGYSGHERGYQVAVSAIALGAKVVEKHFTFDRNMEGNDHKVSLLPDEFTRMVTAIRQVEEALGSDAPRQITQGERINRVNLAKSLIAARPLRQGDIIRRDDVTIKSPGRGLQPNYLKQLLGRRAKHDFAVGDFFFYTDLEDAAVTPRSYKFQRLWGIPVRYYDYRQLTADTQPDFLEFHLSYKDMDLDFRDFMGEPSSMGLVVHSPDLFAGDHILDLASADDAYRQRSIRELQRVVDLTLQLRDYFTGFTTPLVVASLGGFTKEAFVEKSQLPAMYARIADSLAQVNSTGVEIIGQTLPPFPWYFGGQLFLNLFVGAEDTAQFCETYGYRLCLDTSHSKLACNHFGWSFKEFVDRVGPHIAHLHIVDAEGIDSEGLQIGEGDIDFAALAEQLNYIAPGISFIPEIWQGHENNGAGFWIALDRLETWF